MYVRVRCAYGVLVQQDHVLLDGVDAHGAGDQLAHRLPARRQFHFELLILHRAQPAHISTHDVAVEANKLIRKKTKTPKKQSKAQQQRHTRLGREVARDQAGAFEPARVPPGSVSAAALALGLGSTGRGDRAACGSAAA